MQRAWVQSLAKVLRSHMWQGMAKYKTVIFHLPAFLKICELRSQLITSKLTLNVDWVATLCLCICILFYGLQRASIAIISFKSDPETQGCHNQPFLHTKNRCSSRSGHPCLDCKYYGIIKYIAPGFLGSWVLSWWCYCPALGIRDRKEREGRLVAVILNRRLATLECHCYFAQSSKDGILIAT